MPGTDLIDLSTADEALFQPHVETSFTARGEEDEVSLTLLEVSEYPDHRAEDDRYKRKPFSLVFKCDTAVLSQGTYALEHADLAPCELFLSPFEGGENWCKLEAVFN